MDFLPLHRLPCFSRQDRQDGEATVAPPSTELIRISVIIPAVQEQENIVHAIKSAWSAGADEVIVADGGSRDATVRLAREHGARVTVTSPGRGKQQNAAAALATGDVVLFLHADACLDPSCLAQIRSLDRAQPAWTVGAFRQHIAAPGRAFRWLEFGNAARVVWFGMAYGDQAIFLRRWLFTEAGGFPDQPLMEDVALMWRLRSHRPIHLLAGPVTISARRWQKHGIARQTLRNWALLAAYSAGVSPKRLANHYRRHDARRPN